MSIRKFNLSKIYDMTCVPATILGGITGSLYGYNYWKLNMETKYQYHPAARVIGSIYGCIGGAYLSCLWPATISIFGIYFIKEKYNFIL